MILEGLILIALLVTLLAGLQAGSRTYDDVDPRLWQYLRH
jgi:hypothetical protein